VILSEINQFAPQCAEKRPTPVACAEEAVQILPKSHKECNYDATYFSWPHPSAVLYDFLYCCYFTDYTK